MGLGSWFKKYREDKAEQKAEKLQQKALKADMKADYLKAVNEMDDEKAHQILKENGLVKNDGTLVPVGPLQTGSQNTGAVFLNTTLEEAPKVREVIDIPQSPEDVEKRIKEMGARIWMGFGGLGALVLIIWFIFKKK